MKKLLLFFSILLSLFTNGQTSVYRPFPTNFGDWGYQSFDEFGFPTSPFLSHYTLSGDTIIASTNYKKLFLYPTYIGALREASKIVYFVPDTSSTEYILYDFNLGLGDTIISPFGGASCSNDTVIVEQVDSILASDGYHRQLHLSSFAIWIEGIGSASYLLQPAEFLCVSGNPGLQCMINDSLFLYPSASSSCIVSVPKQINQLDDIFVYPNPTNSSVYIEHLNFKTGVVKLYNLTGNEVLRANITSNTTQLDISRFPLGIYFYQITNQNKSYSGKLIKD